ncbi:universal stress protein [Rhodospirillaceae bacterium KN72]|uniref:Universal stress protein n=1 Tax=Pacificispira spongiicola TaxID=2729598 RepID=A0A7Y0DYQ3_9PROT|nr:universal stress protein [Pacificispira spongiicola]NMM44040.1 universal stress protein [Pacificispira spongiicola]
MAISTLLVHLAPDPDCETRLKAAAKLAQEMGAHLVALYVATPVHLPPGAEGRGASAVFLQQAREKAREKATAIEKLVKDICADAGITYDWAYGEADHLDHLLEEVHHVDLTILNQVSFDSFEDRLMYQLPEKLVMGAGGPVLILPKGMTEIGLKKIGTVLVAWTYSKEAIRAMRDALPFLQQADAVKLFTCGALPKSKKDREAAAAAEPVVEYLKRHGVNADHIIHSISGHAGEEILDTAETIHADLIVMGAYGHTSLLDKLFGSASRYVIGHTSVPVLMSH